MPHAQLPRSAWSARMSRRLLGMPLCRMPAGLSCASTGMPLVLSPCRSWLVPPFTVSDSELLRQAGLDAVVGGEGAVGLGA